MEATLFAGALILLMPASFGLIVSARSRGRDATHTMAMHLLVPAVMLAALFSFGFAQLGDTLPKAYHPNWGFHHSRGYFLHADRNNPESLAWFVLCAGYGAVAAVIPAGAVAGRWRLRSCAVFAFVVGGLTFPFYACWMWTGGWLSQMGMKLHLGHGAIDYAGSSVVHLLGGTMALVATLYIGPHLGGSDRAPQPRPALEGPMVVVGSLILAFAWIGFTTGRSFLTADSRAALVVVNTILSGAAGASAAAMYTSARVGHFDSPRTCNGLIAGLVSICASCAYVAPWAAMLIGFTGGIVAAWGVRFTLNRGVEDRVGAVGVHGLAGAWGMIALGLFADGSVGDGANHVAGPVRGLFYGGGTGQLTCQCVAIVACVVWDTVISLLTLVICDRVLGRNPILAETEVGNGVSRRTSSRMGTRP